MVSYEVFRNLHPVGLNTFEDTTPTRSTFPFAGYPNRSPYLRKWARSLRD
jgi:hypothetical protein